VTCRRRKCNALYHRECFQECVEEHGTCAVLGCPSSQSREVSVWGYFVALARGEIQRRPSLGLSRSQVEERVLDALEWKPELLDVPVADMADSEDADSIVMTIEQEFDISIPHRDTASMRTVRELVDYLAEPPERRRKGG
jgi:acyl carrier protein